MRFLQNLAHRDARESLATGALVYLPVNPVEYHGPHLSLRNDAQVCAGLTRDLHRALGEPYATAPPLVTADLEVGVDAVRGPGSRQVPYAVVARLVEDACLALADLGARRVVITTFHGSPLHSIALEAGVKALRRRGVTAVNPFNALLLRISRGGNPGDRDRLRAAAAKQGPEVREALEAWDANDYHAGLMETSLALHYAPDTVSAHHKRVPPCPEVTPIPALLHAARVAATLGRTGLAADLRFAATGLGWYALRPFPGYTGAPHLASASLGADLADFAVEILAAATRAVFEHRAPSPPPLMPWLRTLTLGGRLPSPTNEGAQQSPLPRT